jgi:hypothetical protein
MRWRSASSTDRHAPLGGGGGPAGGSEGGAAGGGGGGNEGETVRHVLAMYTGGVVAVLVQQSACSVSNPPCMQMTEAGRPAGKGAAQSGHGQTSVPGEVAAAGLRMHEWPAPGVSQQ